MDLKKCGIYTIRDFLTPSECDTFYDLVTRPPSNVSDFTNAGSFNNQKWSDQTLATIFYSKLEKHIEPSPLALRSNHWIMTGQYTPGQQFNMHTDTGLYYDRDAREKTQWTLLIYLNDNFEGGDTIFYNEKWEETQRIRPEKGKALLFDIDLWHRGDVLKSGEKRWIGCEIIGVF